MFTPQNPAGKSCYNIGVSQVGKVFSVLLDHKQKEVWCHLNRYALHFQRVSPIGWPKPKDSMKRGAEDWNGSQFFNATSEYKDHFG